MGAEDGASVVVVEEEEDDTSAPSLDEAKLKSNRTTCCNKEKLLDAAVDVGKGSVLLR